MKKITYGFILAVSVALTALYFSLEDRPVYITAQEDRADMLLFGGVYVALLFCTISAVYNSVRKK